MLISFYLSAESFLRKSDPEKIKKRMIRLLIPQVAWAVVYYVIFTSVYLLGLTDNEYKFTDLLWQIVTGHNPVLNATMWFQTDLILLTLLFFGVSYLFKGRNRIVIVLNLMMLAALVIQYSGLNTFLFDDLRYELKYPLGRFCEVMPHAVVGIDLYLIHKKADKNLLKRFVVIGTSGVACVITYCIRDVIQCMGFSYQGLYLISYAVLIYELFAIIPFNKLPSVVKRILYKVSGYTLGIYCMHRLVSNLTAGMVIKLEFVADTSEIYGLAFCVALYVLCYITSAIIYLIPNKYVRQMVV